MDYLVQQPQTIVGFQRRAIVNSVEPADIPAPGFKAQWYFSNPVRSLLGIPDQANACLVHLVAPAKQDFQFFSKTLEIVGVGYNAKMKGEKLVINIGFNAPVEIDIPREIQIELANPTKFTIKGIDKQMVGEFAARIRRIRRPEPYKGKGIRYENEVVKRKAGKAMIGSGT